MMPELPEVETIRAQLEPQLRGQQITALTVLDAKWGNPLAPEDLSGLVEGRTFHRLNRRGKWLIFDLGDDFSLICHLRMTGNFLYDAPAEVLYQRAVFDLSGGHTLRFTDPRRFGTAQLAIGGDALDNFFAQRVGLEPLSDQLDGKRLRRAASGRRGTVKAFLLDQRHVAGIGNIYADEALFRAEVHPLRQAGSLKAGQYDALARSIRDALQAGLDAGGATIDDFRHADGLYGSFQDQFLVHRRAGEPCPRCGNEVRKIVVAGRGTYVCERCQKRPRQLSSSRAAAPASRPDRRS